MGKKRKRKALRYKSKPIPIPVLSLAFLITIIVMYVLNIELPIPLVNNLNIVTNYRKLNTSLILYKVYSPNLQKDTLIQIDIAIREVVENLKNFTYLSLGIHRISKSRDITFINYLSSIILDNRKYIAYLVINKTFTGIPIAYIDANYTRSFDTIIDYYPYQFHFILRIQKCGIELDLPKERNVRKFLVKIVNEDNSTKMIKVDNVVNKTYFFDICGDRIDVESYSSPIPLITIKTVSRYEHYLVLGESPLIILICTPIPVFIFIKSFIKYRAMLKKV
jgi:hypothetical protein